MTNGKGSKVANNFRTPQWEDSKLWKKAKNQRIFEENKHLICLASGEAVPFVGDIIFSGEPMVFEDTEPMSKEEIEKLSLEILDEYSEALEALSKGPEGAHIVDDKKD